ncbi:endocuticle structural glycoprotein SgAbd-2-like isoform X1 [Diaphorina citri]|uniref:Endocuticle structural glycoprotein SgAbd-2-like isoform X1 n=1 Tax=Diaphorina citri TaxID=121845 RepID=A0A1S4EFG5_DIACI|nr:endocuticle structural glycoprotein SgAbd-2-like isoform X2 [Diaphorina citri]XP_017300787.1 endocuticle structural glycoprotein SgAbd-2-like isoform X1 [Diaphorina citri]KAI5699554.1 hypothetical protein M8J75_004881 [Diaphorina citri]KAI5726550.1 hypothetical protein M8J76_004662 [Diaphorina citri]KAI5731246.1 hypothetical protein M8J77_006912 [Diaphorina citri]
MNSFLCSLAFAATLVIVSARPQVYAPAPAYVNQDPKFIPIVRYENNPPVNGAYSFAFETGNGIQVQEQGQLKNAGQKDAEAVASQGASAYTSPEGVPISIQWYADETGYHAVGDHLPTPPPIPAEIARAIATLPKLVEEQPVAYAAPVVPQYYTPSPAPQYYSPTTAAPFRFGKK